MATKTLTITDFAGILTNEETKKVKERILKMREASAKRKIESY